MQFKQLKIIMSCARLRQPREIVTQVVARFQWSQMQKPPSRQLESEIKIPDGNWDIRRHQNCEGLGCIYWQGIKIPYRCLQGSRKWIRLVRATFTRLDTVTMPRLFTTMVWPHLEYGNVISHQRFRHDRVVIEFVLSQIPDKNSPGHNWHINFKCCDSNITYDSLPPNAVSWSPQSVFHGFVTISDTCAEVVKLLLQLCCGMMHPFPEWLSMGIEKNGHLNFVLICLKIVNGLPCAGMRTANEWSEPVIPGFTHVVCSGSTTYGYIVNVPQFERK